MEGLARTCARDFNILSHSTPALPHSLALILPPSVPHLLLLFPSFFPPLPPSPAGLCNPVAAARPRAGPWGEGRGRLGWGREAATRGAACFVPRAPTAAFPAPGCGDRRRRSGPGAGLEAEPREKEATNSGRRPRRSSGQKGLGGAHFG